MKKVSKTVSSAFADFVFDWDYETYLLVGGYGSGKSYDIALKIILKLLQERRRCLVVREVAGTLYDSCYSLFSEILEDMHLLVTDSYEFKRKRDMVLGTKSPLRFKFPNGSEILFRGMDNPEKIKSINGISVVWIEEASEVKYDGFKELQGRVRTPNKSMHFILSCNPVSKENWIYRHFFCKVDDKGNEVPIVDEEKFYSQRCLVHNGVYYHHSVPTDNPWLPWRYLNRLEEMREYDPHLYQVARWGRFGAAGTRVLPQMIVAEPVNVNMIKTKILNLGMEHMYFGMDFGFEESYNALLCMTVDPKLRKLYIWDEVYVNHMVDPDFIKLPEVQKIKRRVDKCYDAGYTKFIVADNAEPKTIQYYKQMGFRMRPCRNKFIGSRLENTRKVKRFSQIIVMPNCKNTIRELKDLTYAKAPNGDLVYDKFNIDPHTFSAIWYALDSVTVADLKDKVYYSKRGN